MVGTRTRALIHIRKSVVRSGADAVSSERQRQACIAETERHGWLVDEGDVYTDAREHQSGRTEAASAGFYTSPGWGQNYPRLQVLTVAEVLAGKGIDMPPLRQVNATFKRAPRANGEAPGDKPEQLGMG